jgi:anti-anti-sigma factor
MAFGYSGGICSGVRAIEHPARIAVEAKTVPLAAVSAEEKLKPMLEVEIGSGNGAVVCVPRGNLDVTTVTTFRGAVASCVGEPGLIIDLSGVQFIDGAGLTAVVGAVRRAQDHGSRVGVVVPAGTVRKVLDEASLELLVRMSETVDVALAEIGVDATSSARFYSPGASDELVSGARRIGG